MSEFDDNNGGPTDELDLSQSAEESSNGNVMVEGPANQIFDDKKPTWADSETRKAVEAELALQVARNKQIKLEQRKPMRRGLWRGAIVGALAVGIPSAIIINDKIDETNEARREAAAANAEALKNQHISDAWKFAQTHHITQMTGVSVIEGPGTTNSRETFALLTQNQDDPEPCVLGFESTEFGFVYKATDAYNKQKNKNDPKLLADETVTDATHAQVVLDKYC